MQIIAPGQKTYSNDCVKHDSFRVFQRVYNAFLVRLYETSFETVDSRFSRYKRVSQQPINRLHSNAKKSRLAQISRRKYQPIRNTYFAFANDVGNAKIATPS